jgi:hypothetical protein
MVVAALGLMVSTVSLRTSSMLRQLRLLEASTASLAILAPVVVTAVTLRRQVLLLLSLMVDRAATERATVPLAAVVVEALPVLVSRATTVVPDMTPPMVQAGRQFPVVVQGAEAVERE